MNEMNELDQKNSLNKENTIDILVSPKKKSSTEEAEHKTSPVKKREDLSHGESIPTKKKMTPKPASETRKIVSVKAPRSVSSASKVAATRVGKISTVMEEAIQKKKPSVQKIDGKQKPVLVSAKKKAKKKTPKEQVPEEKLSLGSTALIALIYIGVVVGISAILSFCGIRWANDVFALVKEEVVATVTIPEDATISEVSKILKENGLIEYPAIFRAYISFKNRDADPPLAFKAGEHEIKSTLNYDQIVSKIKNRKVRRIVTITIPEGFTVDDIIRLFTEQGIGTKEGFVDAINTFDYDYKFMDALNKIELSKERKYRLEGYLFPDTYEFYTDSTEVAIIDKLLAAFDTKFEDDNYARLEEMGMNLDQVVTLASIVQKEGKFNADFYPIAGVFFNRLKSTSMRKLQSDATVQYCLEERKEELSYADLEVESPYNTYRNEGLPPSAIANPGWEAIQATLYPETHSHYYFISDTDGSTIFADNEPQHLANVTALRKAKENGTSID